MPSIDKTILVITNLYPVPWAPNRSSFNKQQFDFIAAERHVKIVVLLPLNEWLKHKKKCIPSDNLKYCPYFYIPKLGRRLVPWFQSLSLMCLLPWMKKQNANTLYASWGFPDAVATSIINKWLNLPLFIKVHGTDVNENTKYPARRALMLKWLSKAENIFCASQALADSLAATGISEKKLSVNYNGVNTEIFYPKEKDKESTNIVFVGNLIPTKGINELLSAFIGLQKKMPEVVLDIIGEGPLKVTIENKVKELGLNIKVHGSLTLVDVAHKIRTSSLLVLPSYREGVPNVLLEAFASGIPVVATKVGGIPEVVNDNVGILVEAKNTDALQEAIYIALNKSWNKTDITEHAKEFDWNRNVKFVLKSMEAG
jgi:glycosyltransferase involved in cell wall biosynthesis